MAVSHNDPLKIKTLNLLSAAFRIVPIFAIIALMVKALIAYLDSEGWSLWVLIPIIISSGLCLFCLSFAWLGFLFVFSERFHRRYPNVDPRGTWPRNEEGAWWQNTQGSWNYDVVVLSVAPSQNQIKLQRSH